MVGLTTNTQANPVYIVDGITGIAANAGSTPLPTYDDQKVFDGLAYTANTTTIAVASGSYLIAELVNPAGSGVNYVMSARVFSSNVVSGAAPVEYARYSAASTLAATPTPTVVTVNNRLTTGPASTATFRYQMGTALPTGGTVTSQGFVPTGGEEKRITDIVVIAPGSKLVYVLGGSGGGLTTAARLAMTFLFYTRAI